MMRIIVVALLATMACAKKRERESSPAPEAPVVKQKVTSCEKPGGTVCADEDVVECLPNGELGKVVSKCNGGCNAGKCVDTCSLRDVELIYVVDDQQHLRSFDPKKLPGDPFHEVGKLACDSKSSPFSMAVDRMGVAWIDYHSGAVYRVSIIDAKCMQARHPTNGAPREFGMGFVADGKDATTETLYVAGYAEGTFAQLDITQKQPVWTAIGRFNAKRNPELTGTGGGQLFGFFPGGGDDGFVQEIDRSTGSLIGKPMPVGSPRGTVGGWAFAHWGGKFYVFITIDDRSMVYEIDHKTGQSKRVVDDAGAHIVGAGVSTCAPLLESVAP
jgi:hypothetical protein